MTQKQGLSNAFLTLSQAKGVDNLVNDSVFELTAPVCVENSDSAEVGLNDPLVVYCLYQLLIVVFAMPYSRWISLTLFPLA